MQKPSRIIIGSAVSLAVIVGAYVLLSRNAVAAGPYGGDVVSIDGGSGYAELVANANTGEVMVHTWDRDLKTVRAIDARTLTLGGDDGRAELHPHPMPGDPAGRASRFYGFAPWMHTSRPHRGWLMLGDGAASRFDFEWSNCWAGGASHGSMWEGMGEHRRMGPGSGRGSGEGHGPGPGSGVGGQR